MDEFKIGSLFKKEFSLEEELDLESERGLNLDQ